MPQLDLFDVETAAFFTVLGTVFLIMFEKSEDDRQSYAADLFIAIIINILSDIYILKSKKYNNILLIYYDDKEISNITESKEECRLIEIQNVNIILENIKFNLNYYYKHSNFSNIIDRFLDIFVKIV